MATAVIKVHYAFTLIRERINHLSIAEPLRRNSRVHPPFKARKIRNTWYIIGQITNWVCFLVIFEYEEWSFDSCTATATQSHHHCHTFPCRNCVPIFHLFVANKSQCSPLIVVKNEVSLIGIFDIILTQVSASKPATESTGMMSHMLLKLHSLSGTRFLLAL